MRSLESFKMLVCDNEMKVRRFFAALLAVAGVLQGSGPSSQVDAQESCGKRSVPLISRIVGGSETSPGVWPWQALLIVKEDTVHRTRCGGTIIDAQFVVTAAHCVTSHSLGDIYVLLGVHNYKNLIAGDVQNISAWNIISHSGYSSVTHENDIALIHLNGKSSFNDKVSPACLPTINQDVQPGKSCWIAGWGFTQDPTQPRSVLREAKIPVISNGICGAWAGSVYISPKHLCVGFEKGGVGICYGDSGGPLLCSDQSSSTFTLYGVSSFFIHSENSNKSTECAQPSRPSVFTRISSFLLWIKNLMQIHSGYGCANKVLELTNTSLHYISSPGYPGLSPHSANCRYNIIAQDGYRISITIEGSTSHYFDFVEVEEKGVVLARLSGKFSKSSFTSDGRTLTLKYITDRSRASLGFTAIYYQYSDGSSSQTQNQLPIIIGAVVGSLVALILLIVVVICMIRKKQNSPKNNNRPNLPAGSDHQANANFQGNPYHNQPSHGNVISSLHGPPWQGVNKSYQQEPDDLSYATYFPHANQAVSNPNPNAFNNEHAIHLHYPAQPVYLQSHYSNQ